MGQPRRSVTVRVMNRASNTGWEVFGSDTHASGIVPENVQLTSDKYGSKTASFDLRRDPLSMWPDLQAFNPVEVEIDGVVVWSGRIKETPARLDPDDRVISVQAEGWQYHMDDDPYWKRYVHTKLSDWQDGRSFSASDLVGAWKGGGTVTTDRGIVLQYPKGTTVQANQYLGVILDLGPSNTAKRVVVNFDWINLNDPAYMLYIRGGTSPASMSTAANDAVSALASNGLSNQTAAGTIPTASRYVAIFIYYNSAGGVINTDGGMRVKSIQVFTDTAYESGNASALKASQVISDGLSHAPLLTQDFSQISTTSFVIPDFSPAEFRSFREYVDAVNVFHNYITMVDVNKRFIFKAQPSVPRLEAGAWSGYAFEDASANSGEDLYNKVIVQGTGPDGNPLTATSSYTGGLITRQGFTRTKILAVEAALTSTSAQQIGDTYLAGHQSVPFKGSVTVVGPDALRDAASGMPVPSERTLLYTNELIRLNDQVDPNTGAIGRAGRIAEVAYDADEDQATITLDNTRANFEALLARYAVVVGSNVQSL